MQRRDSSSRYDSHMPPVLKVNLFVFLLWKVKSILHTLSHLWAVWGLGSVDGCSAGPAQRPGVRGLLLSWGKTVTSALLTHTLMCTFMQRKECASMQTSIDGLQRQIWSCRKAYRITCTKTLDNWVNSLAVTRPSASTVTIIKAGGCQKRAALTHDPQFLISGLQTREWQLRPKWPSFDSSGFLVF